MVNEPVETNVIPFERPPKNILKPDVKEPPTSNWWLGNVKEGNAVWVTQNNEPNPFAPVYQVLKHREGVTLLQDGMNPDRGPQWVHTAKFSRLFTKVAEIEVVPATSPEEKGIQLEETDNGNSDPHRTGVVADPENASS